MKEKKFEIKKNLLKAEFALKGLTLGDVAKILNLTKPTISKKMNGISAWTIPEVQKLSDLIGIEKTIEIFFNN